MTKRISAMKARERFGDILDKVCLQDDQFVIERDGKPVAAIVPIWHLQHRKEAKQRVLSEIRRMHKQMKDANAEELAEEINRAQREVRASRRKSSKRS